jgi:hypothetical protein
MIPESIIHPQFASCSRGAAMVLNKPSVIRNAAIKYVNTAAVSPGRENMRTPIAIDRMPPNKCQRRPLEWCGMNAEIISAIPRAARTIPKKIMVKNVVNIENVEVSKPIMIIEIPTARLQV